MLSQSTTVELIVAVVVLFAIFFGISRLNRRRPDEEDVMPQVDEIDGLGSLSRGKSDSEDNPFEDGIISRKVIAPADPKAKIEAIRERNKLKTEEAKIPAKPAPAVSTVIAIHVMAKPQSAFYGDEINNVLVEAGLHYGDLKVFHRYAEHNEDHGQIIFSVASAVNPGTLPVHLGQQFSCPGLTFFLDFARQKNAVTMFQLMLNTARGIAQSLDGELRDEQRRVWSLTAEQSIRRRIQQYFMQQSKPGNIVDVASLEQT